MEFPKAIPVECTRELVRNSRSTPNRYSSYGKNREPVPDLHLEDESFSKAAMDWFPWSLHPTGLDSFPALRGRKGAVAQLGERLICIQEVAGSIPTSSTSGYRADRACSSDG